MKFFTTNCFVVLALAAPLIFSAAVYAQQAERADTGPDGLNATTVNTQLAAVDKVKVETSTEPDASVDEPKPPKAENINLQDVVVELEPSTPKAGTPSKTPTGVPSTSEAIVIDESGSLPEAGSALHADETSVTESTAPETTEPTQPETNSLPEEEVKEEPTVSSKVILGVEVPANTSTRLVWTPEDVVSGLAERTPVLVVNGRSPGKTLCLTGAVHGDELNGIEMIRRIMYQLEPDKLTGTVIGVPVVNIMGFRRNSRYLPDRRDLNRYFPGNTHGSSASRIAHSFFTNIIRHCDALVDIHTGSFHRTNLTQLRADLSNEQVAELAQSFGVIAVLNSRGNSGSLRAAAVRAGIPSVTVEAGEPMRMQSDVVAEGTKAIETLLAKMGMYGRTSKWTRQAPVYYKSVWVRSDQSGILFSRAPLGKRVVKGEVLGTVTDPITNERSDIVSPYQGRILGMALDQVVLPGFAAYHIGIQTPEAILIEEGLLGADDDGDDVPGQNNTDPLNEPGVVTKPQDSMDDEEE